MLKSELPVDLRRALAGYRGRRIHIGESGADIYQYWAPGRPGYFLKRLRRNAHASLRDEASRLTWMAERMPAPRVVTFEASTDEEWLLMTALNGVNAAEATIPAATVVRVLAGALKGLHAIPVGTCPFDETLHRKIVRARRAVAAGIVEEGNFDEDNRGRTPADVLREVIARRPSREELVVAHGDACLPNFMIAGRRFAGFVDCSRVGRADRYQDLALVCGSIEGNLGSRWVAPFLERYGLSKVDAKRMQFYRLLEELA